MAISRLEALPPEMLTKVVHYVPRPTDLKSLCLTSKTLQAIATPSLYHTVNLDNTIECWPPQPGRGLLRHGHAGLKHIRELQVDGNNRGDGAEQRKLITTLLLALPKDGLRKVIFTNFTVDEATLTTLLSLQTKLTAFSPAEVTFESASLLDSGPFSSSLWSELSSLSLHPRLGHVGNLEAYNRILQQAKKLERLVVKSLSASNGPDGQLLKDTKTKDGLLFQKLFSHISSNPGTPAIHLGTLHLWWQQLVVAQRTLLPVIDFAHLRELALIDCRNWDSFLGHLSDSFASSGCALRIFKFTSGSSEMAPLVDFLGSFKGLQKLYLHFKYYDTAFDKKCLHPHKKTLDEMALRMNDYVCACDIPERQPYCLLSAVDHARIRRIGTLLPAVCLSESDDSLMDSYADLLLSLLTLPAMQSLRIYNLPTAPPKLFRSTDNLNVEGIHTVVKLNAVSYLTELDRFMTLMFQRLGPRMNRSFPAIYFGGNGTSLCCDGEEHIEIAPVCYHTMRQIDIYGNVTIVPRRCPLKEAKYIECGDALLDHW